MKNILIIGPMFSGKSTRIIEEIEKNIRGKKKCLIVRHEIDTRTQDGLLETHGGIIFNNCKVIKTGTIMNVLDIIKSQSINIIAIDEGHFINACNNLSFIKKIYISGLNGDYKREPFETISRLIPLCTIISLESVCECGRRANYTKRLINNNSQILVGGDESYKATCLNCHLNN